MFHLINSSPSELPEKCSEVFDEIASQLTDFAKNASDTPVESTHIIRKKLKCLRAYAKLLQPARAIDEYSTVNDTVRDWGRVFSGLRDAHVRMVVLNGFRNDLNFSSFNRLIAELEVLNRSCIAAIENEVISKQREFDRLPEKISASKNLKHYFIKNPLDITHLTAGFTQSFNKSAEAFERAVLLSERDAIHEWRKRLKDVQYQAEILMNEPDMDFMNFYRDAAELCDLTGIINDQHMLISWLDELRDFRDSTEIAGLINEITDANEKLLKNARAKGDEFYRNHRAGIIQPTNYNFQ